MSELIGLQHALVDANRQVDDLRAENERLLDLARQALGVLKEIQWRGYGDTNCPKCDEPGHVGHSGACGVGPVIAALNDALKETK